MASSNDEEIYIRKVYQRIILFGLLLHFFYIFIFWTLKVSEAAIYNFFSVVFYLGMLYGTKYDRYRTVVSVIHLEVCVFACFCTVFAGWETGMPLYLVAIGSLVYFCPFNRRYIPYLFSLLEFGVFFGLKYYTYLNSPEYVLGAKEQFGLYAYNSVVCFGIILYASFSAKVSAVVSKKVLQDENRSLNSLANYDQLTGLPNRYFLLRKMKNISGPVVLAIGDLDDFKRINDVYGHNCGDYMLQAVSEIMRAECGKDVELCRWGGEEFVFLFQRSDAQEAYSRLRRLCDRINEHAFYYEGEELHMSMTFGLCGDGARENFEELLEAADRQMYRGKKLGKNCVVGPEEEKAED